MRIKRSKKKNTLGTIFFQIFFVVAFLALIAFLVISNLRIGEKRSKLTAQIETLQKEIKRLEEEKAKLEIQIFQSQQKEYVEKRARELGLKKPGEEVVAIKKVEPETNSQELEQEKSFWQKIWEKIQFWRD
jgi:cell division protein FtsB